MSDRRLIAILLAFFLGSLGIQMFYLGNNRWGLILLLFCWTGIPALVGLVQAVVWLFTDDSSFLAKYPPKISSF